MEAYDAYKVYHALKLHFTSNYDYKKYNGKANVSVDSFLKRKDRPFFGRVARKYKDDTKDFFISNFIVNPKGWVGNFNDENYLNWKKRNQSLKYNYKTELAELFNRVETFDEIFASSGQHPLLLKQFMSKKTSMETVAILESLLGFCSRFDKQIKETIVWPDRKKLIKNYSNLLTNDVNEYKIITMQLIKEHFDD
jgi:hypothetical protein|tara:strand:+ start:2843 stop:3427 length:585 start_codon:yes stop_codon:yes gene_type:complete